LSHQPTINVLKSAEINFMEWIGFLKRVEDSKSMQMWRQFAGECGWDSSRPDVVADRQFLSLFT
jgi:hypothetical protein